MKKIVIIGAGGFGREVLDVIDAINNVKHIFEMMGFIDDNLSMQRKTINGYPVLGGLDWFKHLTSNDIINLEVVCGVGTNETRKKITKKLEKLGIKFATLIHPTVNIGRDVKIGKGVIICGGNNLTCNIKIGNHVLINLDCTIGHDTVIEDYVGMSPSVNISGNSTLREGCRLFTNSLTIPSVTVGKWSIIGAGSVVIKNIPEYSVAVGVPAKIIKERNKNEED